MAFSDRDADFANVKKNEDIVHRFIDDVVNNEHPERVDQYLDHEVVLHFPGEPNPLHWADLQQFFSKTRTAFPDYRIQIEELIGEGDSVVGITVQTGTHKGEYGGMPATGKQYKVPTHVLYHLRGGKIIEVRPLFDRMAIMEQLGLAERVMTAMPAGAAR